MTYLNNAIQRYQSRRSSTQYKNKWQRFHLDLALLSSVLLLVLLGLLILYSASDRNLIVVEKQILRFIFAFGIMLIFAQIEPRQYLKWAPFLYFFGTFLLIAVLLIGVISQGAQRWLNLGIFRFQPSEIDKLAVPLMLAWYLNDKPLPPRFKDILICALIILIPTLFIAKQPDLGTALMILMSGCFTLILAGIQWRYVLGAIVITVGSSPIVWHFMHDYQRKRVLTFLNPESDPLGAGYHIIQSKIAIGSGGIFGKGWLNGTQSHLDFLPARATDFIFAVCGEEFGLLGVVCLLSICLFIFIRGMYISNQAQDTFSRLITGSLSFMFFLSVFVNIGMVVGILPVVGIPLPLISYGGSSIVTLLASFGILMSIHTHRRLVSS